jgi:hypothetical protein
LRTHTGAVGAVLCCLAAADAYAHGVVGDRSFIEPFIAEDVNPKNEFVIARPEWDHSRDGSALSVGFGLEKKISDRFSLTLDTEWDTIEPHGAPRESGFNNLGITGKYAFYINPAHEMIFSLALEATAPTGSRDVDAEKDWSFKPFLLYGKGLGDLPSSVKYLRPFALQGDAGFEISLDHDRTTTFAHNISVQYSIPYLQQSVRDFGLKWPFNDLIWDTEFSFEHGVNGEEHGKTSSFVTPGIVYMDRWVELGVAGRFPLNGNANRQFDWGIVWIVDLFIDDILPWTRWQLIGGMQPPSAVPGGSAS